MPWFKQRDISLLGGDGGNDVLPSGVQGQGEAAVRPVHTLSIAVIGVPTVQPETFWFELSLRGPSILQRSDDSRRLINVASGLRAGHHLCFAVISLADIPFYSAHCIA